jgi:hypothetical protein
MAPKLGVQNNPWSHSLRSTFCITEGNAECGEERNLEKTSSRPDAGLRLGAEVERKADAMRS